MDRSETSDNPGGVFIIGISSFLFLMLLFKIIFAEARRRKYIKLLNEGKYFFPNYDTNVIRFKLSFYQPVEDIYNK